MKTLKLLTIGVLLVGFQAQAAGKPVKSQIETAQAVQTSMSYEAELQKTLETSGATLPPARTYYKSSRAGLFQGPVMKAPKRAVSSTQKAKVKKVAQKK